MISFKSFFSLVFLVAIAKISNGQIHITNNDGFELNHNSVIIRNSASTSLPHDWNNCNDGTSTADLQPGNYNVTKKPTEGFNYISLVTRQSSSPGTYETVFADLINPFIENTCYRVGIDACLSNEFYYDDFGTNYYFFNPCYLRVYGLIYDCPDFDTLLNSDSVNIVISHQKLLWQSPLLTDSNWQQFDFKIYPKWNYKKIAVEVYFEDKKKYTNSAVLVDNLHFISSANVFDIKDGFLEIPNSATNIQWFFNSIRVDNYNQITMPLMGTGEYQVSFIDSTGCFVLSEKKMYELPPEKFKLYPNPTNEFLTINSYNYEDKNYEFVIYNSIGQIILSNKFEVKKGTFQNKIYIANLPASAYWVVFKNDSGYHQQISFVVAHP